MVWLPRDKQAWLWLPLCEVQPLYMLKRYDGSASTWKGSEFPRHIFIRNPIQPHEADSHICNVRDIRIVFFA